MGSHKESPIEKEESDHDYDNGVDDLDSILVGVRAYQVQLDDDEPTSSKKAKTTKTTTLANKIDTTEEGVIISYYERSFPIGSIFSFPIQAASAAKTNGVERNPATITISPGSKLSIHTVSIDPETETGKPVALYISTDTNPDYLCICPCLTNNNPIVTEGCVTSLNVEVCGPAVIHLAANHHARGANRMKVVPSNVSVNVFGSVSILETSYGNAVAEAKNSDGIIPTRGTNNTNSIDTRNTTINDTTDKQQEVDKATTKRKKEEEDKDTETPELSKNQRRKLSKRKATVLELVEPTPPSTTTTTETTDDPKIDDPKEETTNAETTTTTQTMTKKQRRKLAKQKAMELEDVIARERGYPTIKERDQATNDNEANNSITKNAASKSLTRQRSLPGGILLQDILHGLGPTARTGRKVAIHYKGTFPETGKVFDKNQTKGKPLVFRVGTGEVIQGLERGIEGMKVGGERLITIPPKFGYGKMGQPEGGIPKNARLCFAVTLVSVGGNV